MTGAAEVKEGTRDRLRFDYDVGTLAHVACHPHPQDIDDRPFPPREEPRREYLSPVVDPDENDDRRPASRHPIRRSNSVLLTSSSLLRNDGSELKSCMSVTSLVESLGSFDTLGGRKRSTLKSKLKRGVSFCSVEVREHGPELGDNPSCFVGPPVTIEWEHHTQSKFPVDKYEEHRCARRRDKRGMLIPSNVRVEMVKSAGSSWNDINGVRREINVIARRRDLSAQVGNEKFDEAMEKFVRKARRFLGRKSKKKEERRMWIEAQSHEFATSPKILKRSQSLVELSSFKILTGEETKSTKQMPSSRSVLALDRIKECVENQHSVRSTSTASTSPDEEGWSWGFDD